MLLIIGILLVFLFGYLLSVALVEKMHVLERFGSAFLLGFGIITLLMFCYSTLGLRITLESALAAIGICIVFTFLVVKLLHRKLQTDLFNLLNPPPITTKFEKMIIMSITGLILGSLIISTYFPVYIWDALALYDFRGKIIAQQGFYTQIANNFFWFTGYPLFTSLGHTLVYLFGGNNPQFFYSLIYISFIFVFYGAIREFVSRKVGLITTLILASTPVIFDHSTFAYTNLPYSVFLSMGSIYLFVWFAKKKGVGYLILAAIMTGLSTWTRSTEPFWIVNILLLLALSLFKYKKYLVSSLIYIFSFLLIREPWVMVNYYILNDTGEKKAPLIVSEAASYASALFGVSFNFERISEIFKFVYANVIVSWYPLLFLFLFCLIINTKTLFKRVSSFFLIIFFLYFSLLLYATYVYSLSISYWFTIPDSARRMAMFFMPLMIYYVGLTFGRISYKKNGTKRGYDN